MHYLECRAIGRFPDDSWVRRNAVIVRRIEDMAAGMAANAPLELLVGLIAKR